jgi:hypothetical protein
MLVSLVAAVGLLVIAVGPLLAHRAVVHACRRARRRTWEQFEEEQSTEPLAASKTAQVLVRTDGTDALFVGVTLGRAYRVDSMAACPRMRCRPPGLDCDCGFYAFKTRADALDLLDQRLAYNGLRSKSLLTVELSGSILQYERGYRAERQVVHRVEFARRCARCEERGRSVRATVLAASPRHRAEPLGRADLRFLTSRPPDYVPVHPVCDAHVPPGRETRVLNPVDLAGLLGTEVMWLPDPAGADQEPEGARRDL